jgi:phospholipid/cholesterol/gamma-HCH transport system ATP-binding protein
MRKPIIELKDAAFSAQTKDIVREFSYQFEEGKVTALIGPSGGGKSTVLKLAAGLIVPTKGEAFYRGSGISTMTRAQNTEFRKESAFVFQDSALWANQTLRQILELPLKTHFPKMTQGQRTERIVGVLAKVGYRRDIDVRPSQLSMGEQKLIAFARAMMCDPKLMCLDEWTESLDDGAARRLVDLVKAMRDERNTVIFVSHNFRVIRELAQTICMIIDGRLSMIISAEDIETNEGLAKMIEKGIAI